MLRFTRTISVKHHPTGDHYSVSIPRPVAEALNLHEDGGLVSIEIVNKWDPRQKGVQALVVLKAYRDTYVATRDHFDPTQRIGSGMWKASPIEPRTLGPSKPCGCGKIYDKATLKDLRACRIFLTAQLRSFCRAKINSNKEEVHKCQIITPLNGVGS